MAGLTREFVFGSMTLADPDPGLSPEQVKAMYATAYSDLTTASVAGPEAVNGKQVYTFKKAVGTKG